MHDDSLERRLRAALQTEGDRLPLTITSDELRRRLDAHRRGRMGRPGMLLLAAALGVGLVGIGAVAGGWLERHATEPSPAPSGRPNANGSAEPSTPGPSTEPSRPPLLPSLDAFLAPLDPGRIVRAQSIGPVTEPTSWGRGLDGPGSTDFAPFTASGSYRVWLACLGADQLALHVAHADASMPVDAIPITCDGNTTARDLGLAAGDVLSVAVTTPTSWRMAVLAPDRPAPHAGTIASAADLRTAAGPRGDADAAGDRAVPDPAATGPATTSELPVAYLNDYDSYRIAVSCAGPGPLTYELRPPVGVTPAIADDAGLSDVATTVECTGAATVDVIHLPFANGAEVYVTAPAGVAWRLSAAFGDRPIQSPPDGDGWTMGIGLGPNLIMNAGLDEATATLPKVNRVRVVVTCLGGSGVDVTLRDVDTGATTSGSASCTATAPTVTIIPVTAPGRSFFIQTTTHGSSSMWVAVTIQQRAAGAGGG